MLAIAVFVAVAGETLCSQVRIGKWELLNTCWIATYFAIAHVFNFTMVLNLEVSCTSCTTMGKRVKCQWPQQLVEPITLWSGTLFVSQNYLCSSLPLPSLRVSLLLWTWCSWLCPSSGSTGTSEIGLVRHTVLCWETKPTDEWESATELVLHWALCHLLISLA